MFNFHRGKSDSSAILYKLESKYYNLKLNEIFERMVLQFERNGL
jgi:hypothetical protein